MKGANQCLELLTVWLIFGEIEVLHLSTVNYEM
jgi:hypothetical protein